MKHIIKIFLLCLFSISLLVSCKEDDSLFVEPPKEEAIKFATANPKNGCAYHLYGFADFPFQSNVINHIDYPISSAQLSTTIGNEYFQISSKTLKICETGFEEMSHHNSCSSFSPIQITFFQVSSGTKMRFDFESEFWECFYAAGTYPGMDFRFEHSSPFI